MKQIKLWLIAILAILAVGALSSCSDDDDVVIDSPIVGVWSYSESDSYGGVDDQVVFKKNGTYEWTITEYDYGEDEETYKESGTYSVTSNKLTLKCSKISGYGNEGPISKYVGETTILGFTVSGNTLTINLGDEFAYYTKK